MDSNIIELPLGKHSINDLVGLPLHLSERILIEAALKRNLGNKSKTAKVLGICIRTLRTKLKSYQSYDQAAAA